MIYHSAIFYPEDKDELRKLASIDERKEEGSAFILPQMMLSRSAFLYRQVFGRIADGREITLIVPLRREMLEKDRGSLFFQNMQDSLNLPAAEDGNGVGFLCE